MNRILSAFFLTILISAVVFIAHIYPSGNISQSLYHVLPMISTIGSATLVICVVFPHQHKVEKANITGCFIFLMSVLCVEIFMREIFVPHIISPTETQISSEDFLLNGHPLSKKGILFASGNDTYVLGEVLRQDNAYIGRNLVINRENSVLHAPFFQINNGRLFTLNIRKISNYKTNILDGIEELPLPISFDALYDLWGVPSPQRVSLISLLRSPDVISNKMSYPYHRVILLAIARYGASLVLLIMAIAIGTSAQGRMNFHGVQKIGTIAFMMLSFPISGIIYYALILLANSIILYIL